MFTEKSGALQAVGRFMRAKEQPAAGEKGHQDGHADDQGRGWEPLRVHSREDRPAETDEHVKEEFFFQPAALISSVLKTAVPGRRDVGRSAARFCPRGDEEAGRVGGGASSSDRWAALQVSIPRLEVNGQTAKFVADGGSSSGSSSGSVTAAAIAAALSGVPSRARAAGVHANAASTGISEGGAATFLVGPPSDGEVTGVANCDGVTTAWAGKVAANSGAARAEGVGVAVSSLFLSESRPLSLPAVRGIPEATMNQPPSPPTPPSQNVSPVEIHVNEEGGAEYRFSKSAPPRRGKWSRMEEEYAKRIIRDFDEGVIDAPAGVGLRQLLSSKLHCEVMRVSKKFCGWQCVGKRCYRPVFHHDGRTTRARASLFEMEQKWLKTFPSPSRAKPATVLERPASLSPDAGVGSCKRGSTGAQAWLSLEERGPTGETSTGAIESPAKGGRPQRGSAIPESADEKSRGPPSRGEQGQEVERQRHDDREIGSPVADGGDQQQVRAVSHSGGYDHRRRLSVGTGNGSSSGGPNGRHGVNRRSWTPSSSHGSHYMQGGASPREPEAYPRDQHCENMRSPPTGLPLWQRAEADRLPTGRTGGSDRDTDLYPVFSKRGGGGGDTAASVRRVAYESAVADGGDEVSHASRNGWAQGQEARPHQRQPQFPCTNMRREGGHARENDQKRHREGIRATVSSAPAGGTRLARREHDVGRHGVSATDQTYPDPFPHYESERQRTSGRYIPRGGGGNGRHAGGRSSTEAAVERRAFRLELEPAALPLHLRVDSHREAFFPGNKKAAAPKPGRYFSEASHGVGPPPEPSSKRHCTSRQFGKGPEHHYYSAKEERRVWEDDLPTGLEEHRPAKTPRVTGLFSHLGTGGRSADRGGDDRSLYPTYRKKEHQPQLQQQRQRRHPGTSAIYWQSGQRRDNGDVRAAIEAYTPGNHSNLMGGDATPPLRPPSRDCFFRVSASPTSMVVPSNEYGPVVVGPGGVQSFCTF